MVLRYGKDFFNLCNTCKELNIVWEAQIDTCVTLFDNVRRKKGEEQTQFSPPS